MPKSTQLLSTRDVIGRILLALEGLDQNSWPFQIAFYNEETNQEFEKYVLTTMAPTMRRWIGGRSVKELSADFLLIQNVKYEASMRVAVDDMRRDKTGQIQRRIGEMVSGSTRHWAKLLSELIRLGDATTTTYDDKNFFATDHEKGDSGPQSNLFSKPGGGATELADLQVTDLARPTEYEMAHAIGAVINEFYGWLDDEGEPINEDAMSFLVQVPTRLLKVANAAVTKQSLNTGAGVTDNFLNEAGYSVSVRANPRFRGGANDPNRFYVFRTDGATDAFIMQSETGVEVGGKGDGSEHEFDYDEHVYGIKANRGVGFGLWMNAAQATLAQ